MTVARPIRVLYVSPVAERGGAEVVLLNILKFHDRRSFDPIVCFLKSGPLVDEVRALGIRTVAFDAGRIRNVSRTFDVVRAMRRLIRAERIDIVFSNMGSGHVFGGLAALGTEATAVWYQHGLPDTGDALSWFSALIPAARIYSNSQATAAAQARLPGGRGRLQLMSPGIDISRFNPAPRPHRHPVVAMVARFQRWKGQDVLVRAAAQVIAQCPDVRFVLIGEALFGLEPDYRRYLHDLVDELGLTAHVTFAGFQDDVAAALNEVDIFVHSHRRPEPFGLAIAEAMLMEKPVIASSSGGPAEFISHGEDGVLIPPDDVPALTRAILDLVQDPAKRCALGRAGRALVQRRFDMGRMIHELEASYRSLATEST